VTTHLSLNRTREMTVSDPALSAVMAAYRRTADPGPRLARARAALHTGDAGPAYVVLAGAVADAALLAAVGQPGPLAALALALDAAGPNCLESAPAACRPLLEAAAWAGWHLTHIAPDAGRARAVAREGRAVVEAAAAYRKATTGDPR
jgi:hypothetical protein